MYHIIFRDRLVKYCINLNDEAYLTDATARHFATSCVSSSFSDCSLRSLRSGGRSFPPHCSWSPVWVVYRWRREIVVVREVGESAVSSNLLKFQFYYYCWTRNCFSLSFIDFGLQYIIWYYTVTAISNYNNFLMKRLMLKQMRTPMHGSIK